MKSQQLIVVFGMMMNLELDITSNLTPIVLWQINGTARVGFPIEFVCRSWDNDGYIAARQWYRDGTPISTADRISFTETLAEGEVSKTVTIQLKVKDDKGLWSELRTSVLTNTKSGQTEYYLTDHLGSIRTTIDQTGTVIGFDDYDPFGNVLPGRSYNAGTPNDLNKFTGHERDQEGGIDLDYMLARNYDSELGRFYSVDPHSNKLPSLSPYNYTMNNPIYYKDPDGEFAISFLTGFFRSLFNGNSLGTSVTGGWNSVKNEASILSSFFRGNARQVVSKFTWELPQQAVGVMGGILNNWFGNVQSISHQDGATMIETKNSGWGGKR